MENRLSSHKREQIAKSRSPNNLLALNELVVVTVSLRYFPPYSLGTKVDFHWPFSVHLSSFGEREDSSQFCPHVSFYDSG